MSDAIERQLGELQRMTTSDLVDRYEELHGHACRTRHRAYLIRKVDRNSKRMTPGSGSRFGPIPRRYGSGGRVDPVLPTSVLLPCGAPGAAWKGSDAQGGRGVAWRRQTAPRLDARSSRSFRATRRTRAREALLRERSVAASLAA